MRRIREIWIINRQLTDYCKLEQETGQDSETQNTEQTDQNLKQNEAIARQTPDTDSTKTKQELAGKTIINR